MLSIFKSKRAGLFEQKAAAQAAFDREDARFAGEIDRLGGDPDVVAYRHAIKLEREIKLLEERRREAASAAREKIRALDGEICGAADSRIWQFIRWAIDEKTRLSKELMNRGVVERNSFGFQTGYILTNAAAIEGHLVALNSAIAAARCLETLPNDDAADALEKIRASVPIFDASKTEKIDCGPGLAAALL
jgi:hypothetical protein